MNRKNAATGPDEAPLASPTAGPRPAGTRADNGARQPLANQNTSAARRRRACFAIVLADQPRPHRELAVLRKPPLNWLSGDAVVEGVERGEGGAAKALIG